MSNQVDPFAARLAKELGALDWKSRSDLLIAIGKADMRMRTLNQDRPLWRGPASESEVLGANVVVQTEQGERRGRVIGFGITKMPDGIEYERSVIVHVQSSGTHHEVAGSITRFASKEDSERMQGELVMGQKLAEVAEAVTRGPTPLPDSRPPKRRGEKDPALIAKMLDAATQSPNVKVIEDGSTNHKIVGLDSTKRIYLFKTQLRVDISGFTVDHPGIRTISDAEARDMHLGKVRGQLLYANKVAAYDGFVHALTFLCK